MLVSMYHTKNLSLENTAAVKLKAMNVPSLQHQFCLWLSYACYQIWGLNAIVVALIAVPTLRVTVPADVLRLAAVSPR